MTDDKQIKQVHTITNLSFKTAGIEHGLTNSDIPKYSNIILQKYKNRHRYKHFIFPVPGCILRKVISK